MLSSLLPERIELHGVNEFTLRVLQTSQVLALFILDSAVPKVPALFLDRTEFSLVTL